MVHRSRQWLSVVMMFIILLFSNASREWLHDFANHTDTVHNHSDDLRKGTVFENEHHHCKFLDIPLPSYLQPTVIEAVHFNPVYFECAGIRITCQYNDNSPSTKSNRGPPARFHIS